MILGAIEGLSAWWLAAGVAASAPVVVAHLLGRRSRKVIFPPASLLMDRASNHAAGKRLRDVARLVMRVLAILLIAAVFDAPAWRSHDATGAPPAGRDLLVIIDASASMGRVDRGARVFDRAIAEALRRIDDLDPADDRAAVIAIGAAPITLLPKWSANFAALRDRVRAAEPAREHGDAPASMRLAADFVGRSLEAGRSPHVIVISDAQLSQWGGVADNVAGVETDWVDLGATAPRGNVALTGFVTPAEIVHPGESVRVGVRLALFDAEITTIPVTLNADGAAHIQAVTLEPGAERVVWFDVAAPSSGQIVLRAGIPADALIADNFVEAIVEVRDRPSIVIAASRRDADYMNSLTAAVEAVTGAAPDLARTDDLAPSPGDVLVLAGAIDVRGVARASDHLEHAGSLVWIIDSQAAAKSLADAAERGLLPVSPGVYWLDDSEARVDPVSARAFFGDPSGAAAAVIDEIARDARVSGRAVVDAASAGEILSLDNGDPLVLIFDTGDARTAIITADPSPGASDITKTVLWPMLLDRALRRPAAAPLITDALDPRESDLAALGRGDRAAAGEIGSLAERAIASRASRAMDLAPMLLLVALAIVLGDLLIGSRSGPGWWAGVIGAAMLVVPLADPRGPADTGPAPTRSLLITLDISESMAIADVANDGDRRRIDAVRAWLPTDDMMHIINNNNTRVAGAMLDGALTSATIESLRDAAPTGRDSPLVSSVERAIHAVGVNGRVLLLTDGADTERRGDIGAVADRAAAAGVRFDAVVVGSEINAGETRLFAWATPGAVYDGEIARISVEIAAPIDDAVVRLELRTGGADGMLIESREVAIANDDVSSHSFDVTPTGDFAGAPGWSEYAAALVTGDEGSLEVLASQTVFIEVFDKPARVLALEGRPGWQSAFFVDALRDEPRLDVTSVSAVTPGRQIVRRSGSAHAGDDPTADRARMFEGFDLVVLGRSVGRWLDDDAAAALERYVTRGGAVLMLRGDPIADDPDARDSLRRVIDRFMPEVGAADESLARAMGDLDDKLSDGRMSGASLLSVRRIGMGRSAIAADEEMWRFAFTSDEHRRTFGEFWSRAARWLALGGAFMPGRYARLEFDETSRAPGETVSATLRIRGGEVYAPIRAVALDPDGRAIAASVDESGTDGRDRRIRFTPTRGGAHVLRAESEGWSIAAPIMVESVNRERVHIAARPGWLRDLTAATGGRLWSSDDVNMYVRDILAPDTDDAPMMSDSASMRTEPIWNSAWFFTVLAGTIVAGWILRREVVR